MKKKQSKQFIDSAPYNPVWLMVRKTRFIYDKLITHIPKCSKILKQGFLILSINKTKKQ